MRALNKRVINERIINFTKSLHLNDIKLFYPVTDTSKYNFPSGFKNLISIENTNFSLTHSLDFFCTDIKRLNFERGKKNSKPSLVKKNLVPA